MKNVGNKQHLESSRLFPYIAWFLVFVFAYIVFSITQELQAVTKEIESKTTALETKTKQPVEAITDFEN